MIVSAEPLEGRSVIVSPAPLHEQPDSARPERIHELTQQFCELWWQCPTSFPELDRAYTRREQSAAETELGAFIDDLLEETDPPPCDAAERETARQRIMTGARLLARDALGLDDGHLAMLGSDEMAGPAIGFVQRARAYDPQLGFAEIFQASRNAWTMYGLQRLLGLPVALTPSVFAYSMLYPYSDNLLDDPLVSLDDKRAFNDRLTRRLHGMHVESVIPLEARVYELVGMIEQEHARQERPDVYHSLLAIHKAQIDSVQLTQRWASPYEVDVLGITVEKGGTSVLADGYLVAGTLSREQTTFLFGWGALLQLVDDLQDLQSDLKAGQASLYAQTGSHWPIDAIVCRTFHYCRHILGMLACFGEEARPLQELMSISAVGLLIDAVGRSRGYMSGGMLRRFQAYSAFRYGHLRRYRHRIRRRSADLERLVMSLAES